MAKFHCANCDKNFAGHPLDIKENPNPLLENTSVSQNQDDNKVSNKSYTYLGSKSSQDYLQSLSSMKGYSSADKKDVHEKHDGNISDIDRTIKNSNDKHKQPDSSISSTNLLDAMDNKEDEKNYTAYIRQNKTRFGSTSNLLVLDLDNKTFARNHTDTTRHDVNDGPYHTYELARPNNDTRQDSGIIDENITNNISNLNYKLNKTFEPYSPINSTSFYSKDLNSTENKCDKCGVTLTDLFFNDKHNRTGNDHILILAGGNHRNKNETSSKFHTNFTGMNQDNNVDNENNFLYTFVSSEKYPLDDDIKMFSKDENNQSSKMHFSNKSNSEHQTNGGKNVGILFQNYKKPDRDHIRNMKSSSNNTKTQTKSSSKDNKNHNYHEVNKQIHFNNSFNPGNKFNSNVGKNDFSKHVFDEKLNSFNQGNRFHSNVGKKDLSKHVFDEKLISFNTGNKFHSNVGKKDFSKHVFDEKLNSFNHGK